MTIILKEGDTPVTKPGFKVLEGTRLITLEMIDWPKDPYETIFQMTYESFQGTAKRPYLTSENLTQCVKDVLAGRVLPNALEALKFTFRFYNVSRTFTHQWVRTRVGANFTQFTQRGNDVRHREVRIPWTVAQNPRLAKLWKQEIQRLYNLYVLTRDEYGIAPQDARFILPEGSTGSIVTTMTFNTIRDVVSRRACANMQWEICYCAYLLADWFQRWDSLLGSVMIPLCDKTGKCMWSMIEFPPCDRHPLPDNYQPPVGGYLSPFDKNGSLEFQPSLKGQLRQDGKSL